MRDLQRFGRAADLHRVAFRRGALADAQRRAGSDAARFEQPQRVREILAQTRLDPLTHYTETNPDKLLERVRKVARRGYAVIENETVLGDISVAAPVTDHGGMAVAAINISVPTSRWSTERVEAELAQHVQVAATSISKARLATYKR